MHNCILRCYRPNPHRLGCKMTLKQWIDYAQADYTAAYSWGANLGTRLRQTGTQLKAGNLDAAGDTIYEAGTYAIEFALSMTTRYTHLHYRIINALYWIDDNWPETAPPVELTMDALLSVMLKATNEQLQYFIGLVDAYRQSIWDKPFNQEYFAALARGFAEWE